MSHSNRRPFEFLAGVAFAHRSTTFAQKALSFQILFTNRTVEALAVVIVIHSFNPTITSLDRVATSVALGGKKLIPISFAVRQTIFQIEMTIAEKWSAVSTREAFRMKLLANRIQTIAFDAFWTAGTVGSQVGLETSFAIELLLLFDESNVVQFTFTIGHGAAEMIRTPSLA